jgi:hypothetical protein
MSEQKTFKYLDQANAQGGDAAQDFLNKKLSKNKYMSVSNPDNPYSMGEGTTPDGTAYPGSKASIAADKAAPAPSNDHVYEDGWVRDAGKTNVDWSDTWNEGANYQQIKGDGKLDSAYEERFNKLTNQDNTDVDNHGAGWKNLDDMGTMGSTEQMKALAAEWEKAGYDVRVQDMEGHGGVGEANIAVRKGANQETAPKAKVEKATPIEHSPEIKQAKERVQSYEQDALTGKTSEAIFGKGEAQADGKYQFDATQGIKAFGSSPANEQAASAATQSFLDKKVFDVKKKLEPSV